MFCIQQLNKGMLKNRLYSMSMLAWTGDYVYAVFQLPTRAYSKNTLDS